jgi:flagellar motor switch protein FliN/FliY
MSDQSETIQTPAGSAEQTTEAGAFAPRAAAASNPSPAAPLLMGVKLPIRVLLGRTQLCLRDIAQLGNGAVVELDCSPDDPVEIIVNGRIIAHGEVVVVSGNYGVRITKIASQHQDAQAENRPSDLFSLSDKLR